MNQNVEAKQARQGDLVFDPFTGSIPSDAYPVIVGPDGSREILRGASTGHTHRLEPGAKGKVYRYRDDLYVALEDAANVIHDEHKPVRLEAATYRVVRPTEDGADGYLED